MVRNSWRSSSEVLALIRQRRSRSRSRGVRGPCICMSGPHHRSSASWIWARCVGRAGDHGHDHVAAMHDVDRLLPADLAHRPRVRRVRAVAQRLLGDDRGGIDEPGDEPDVGPRHGRVVEHVVELGPAGEQVVEHRLARLAEVLGDAVQELGVPDLVLDLGGQGELPAQGRRPHDPVPLGEHAHQLGVGVHLDEAQDRRPVRVRHRVGRLDLAAGGEIGLEAGHPVVVRRGVVVRRRRGIGALRRGQDRVEGSRVGHGRPTLPNERSLGNHVRGQISTSPQTWTARPSSANIAALARSARSAVSPSGA